MQPPGPDDETATAVGWVAIEAARLELVAAQLSAALIGSSRALNLTLGQAWAVIAQGLDSTVRDHGAYTDDPGDRTHFQQIGATLAKARTLMEDRSRVVHAIWDPPGHDGYRAALRVKRAGRVESRAWSLPMLTALRNDLRTAAVDFGAHLHWAVDRLDE